MSDLATPVRRESSLTHPPPLIPAPRAVSQGLVATWCIAVAITATVALFNDRAMFLVYGWTVCLVVTLPMLSRRYDFASPWSLVLLTIYIGCGLRSWFIARGIESGDRSLNDLFLLGQGPDFFDRGSLYFLIGTALMTAAYSVASKPHEPKRSPAPYAFSKPAGLLVAILAGVGFVAFVLFAQRTGGLGLDVLSAKRTNIDSLDLTNYQSQGQLRLFATSSSYAYWIATAMFAASTRRRTRFDTAILGALFLNAIALPVYASIRSDAAYILIIGTIISLCVNPRRTRRLGRTAARGFLLVLVIVTVLTVLRASGGTSAAASSALSEEGGVSAAIGSTFVYNRNFTDIPTAVQVIEAVPDKLAPAYGDTYLPWTVALIPRQWWPEKPLVSSGPLIGVRVFGQASSGVPPGMIGEAYWNFGLPGVVIISLLAGLILRRTYEWWLPRLHSPAAVVIFAAGFLRLGEGIVANSFGYALFQAALTSSVLAGLLWLMRAPRPRIAKAGE